MSRPQQPENLKSSRRSRTYYPVEPGLMKLMQAVSFEGYYTFLLHEDLDFVIPYNLDRPGGPQARVTGPDAQKAAPLIERALSGEDWTPSISDLVRDFVSSTAQHLVISGPVTYEIDYLYEQGTSSGSPAEFRLELIPPGTLSRHGRQPIQYVPSASGGPRDKTGLTYVELDPETLVTFRLDPAEEAAVRKMVTFLRAASAVQGAEVRLLEQSADAPTAYSFAEYHRELGDLFAEATEPIGWNARSLFQSDRLAPYEVWRQLRFAEFKIRLRDLIMDRLNAALAQAGSKLGFQAAIALSGLPTLQDIDKAKSDLRTGDRSLNDLAAFAM